MLKYFSVKGLKGDFPSEILIDLQNNENNKAVIFGGRNSGKSTVFRLLSDIWEDMYATVGFNLCGSFFADYYTADDVLDFSYIFDIDGDIIKYNYTKYVTAISQDDRDIPIKEDFFINDNHIIHYDKNDIKGSFCTTMGGENYFEIVDKTFPYASGIYKLWEIYNREVLPRDIKVKVDAFESYIYDGMSALDMSYYVTDNWNHYIWEKKTRKPLNKFLKENGFNYKIKRGDCLKGDKKNAKLPDKVKFILDIWRNVYDSEHKIVIIDDFDLFLDKATALRLIQNIKKIQDKQIIIFASDDIIFNCYTVTADTLYDIHNGRVEKAKNLSKDEIKENHTIYDICKKTWWFLEMDRWMHEDD